MPLSHVVFADYVPRPDRHSGGRRLVEIMKLLGADAPVYFSYTIYRDAIETRHQLDKHGLQKVRLAAENDNTHPRVTFAKELFDLALPQAWHIAEKVLADARRLQPWCAFVVDTTDLQYLRDEAAVQLKLLDAVEVAQTKKRELDVYRAADALVAITEEELAILRAEGFTQPIFIIPNIVPLLARESIARKREISFIGGFSHTPNTDGITWFVEECWPFIIERVPEAQLTIVGSNPTAAVLELAERPGIVYAGCVPETAPYLQAAAVSIAPLRYGAGMKGKVCEAMAAGVPVVSTTIGMQGISARDRIEARIADDPQDFALAVVELLQDPVSAEQLGAAGQKVISQLCGPTAAATAVSQLLEWVHSRPLPSRWQRRWWRLYGYYWKGYLRCRMFLNRRIRAPKTQPIVKSK